MSEPHPRTSARRLIVCADDYAMTPGVSRAIRELIEKGRISATSAMTASPYWQQEAKALSGRASHANIGLHLTLTDQRPIRPMPRLAPTGVLPSMPALYRAAMMRALPLSEIADELASQVDAFMAHYGAPPAHIDGHHHVHQLPGIRDLVVALAARLAHEHHRPVWVRNCYESPARIWRRGIAPAKSLVIGSFGRALAHRAAAAGVPYNHGFSGAYDHAIPNQNWGTLFSRFIDEAGENALVMCHPGYSDAELARLDAMTSVRDGEYVFLMGADWLPLVTSRGLEIGPYRHRPA